MTLDKARKVKMVLTTKSERRDDRAQAQGLAGGRRRHRQHVHEQERPVRLLRGADGGRLQDWRDVLAARQGHDDEGVAPHRLRPRGEGLLQGRVRQASASCSTNWASTSTTGCPICTARSSRCPRRSARRSSATCTPATSTGPSWPWWTRPEVSRTSIRPATSSWTPRCPR